MVFSIEELRAQVEREVLSLKEALQIAATQWARLGVAAFAVQIEGLPEWDEVLKREVDVEVQLHYPAEKQEEEEVQETTKKKGKK